MLLSWLDRFTTGLFSRNTKKSRTLNRPRRSLLRVEEFEERVVPTATLFLEYGDSFTSGILNTTAGTLVASTGSGGIQGPDLVGLQVKNSAGTNVTIQASDTIRFRSLDSILPTSFDFNGDGVTNASDRTALRTAVNALITRSYSPLNIDIQTVANSTIAQINSTLTSNNGLPSKKFDAYAIIGAAFLVTSSGEEISIGKRFVSGSSVGGLNGIAPGSDLGTSGNITSQGNNRDDAVLIFVDSIVDSILAFPGSFSITDSDTAIANITSHEAGHAFGLRHTFQGTTPGDDFDLLSRSDIMGQFSTVPFFKNELFFTSFPLNEVPGEFNSPAPAYDRFAQLISDSDIGEKPGARAFVTGTGANDEITLTLVSPGIVQVSVTAYRDVSRFSQISTTYTYQIDITNGIEVRMGDGEDQLTINNGVTGTIIVDGGLGGDGIIVHGSNATNDIFRILQANSDFDRASYLIGSVTQSTVDTNNVDFILFDGMNGTDSLTVDASFGALRISEVAFVGGGGTNDAVLFSGSNANNDVFFIARQNLPNFDKAVLKVNGVTQATVDILSTESITFAGLSGNDSLSIDAPSGPLVTPSITFDGGTGTDDRILIGGTDGNDIFFANHVTGTSNDKVTLTISGTLYASVLFNNTDAIRLLGGNGNDSLSFDGPSGALLTSAIEFDGGSVGNDAVLIAGTALNDTFIVSKEAGSNFDVVTLTTNGVLQGRIRIAGVDTTTLTGGNGNDQFAIGGNPGAVRFRTQISGGAGTDTVTVFDSTLISISGSTRTYRSNFDSVLFNLTLLDTIENI